MAVRDLPKVEAPVRFRYPAPKFSARQAAALRWLAAGWNLLGFFAKVSSSGLKKIHQEEPPKVVLLDLMFPEVKGFDVLSSIKQNQKCKDVPVIILSNLGGSDDIERGMKLGATDYIVKANAKIDGVVKKVKDIMK